MIEITKLPLVDFAKTALTKTLLDSQLLKRNHGNDDESITKKFKSIEDKVNNRGVLLINYSDLQLFTSFQFLP